MIELSDLLSRWDSNEGKPYKGRLIDWKSYGGDGEVPLSCMCAQGQVLHVVGGWGPERLRDVGQVEADRETAKLLGISIAHAILLRNVNDRVEGAPSIVLTAPEKVLGDQAHIVPAFWRHLDRMTGEQWDASWAAAGAASWAAARDAARATAGAAARDAARAAARATASYACAEIQGARILRERGRPFFFLPMYGFADPEAVLAADEGAHIPA